MEVIEAAVKECGSCHGSYSMEGVEAAATTMAVPNGCAPASYRDGSQWKLSWLPLRTTSMRGFTWQLVHFFHGTGESRMTLFMFLGSHRGGACRQASTSHAYTYL